jgi:uncharacterized protein YaeQ
MANPSTLYRFKISLSDVDRAVYETLQLRVAMHSSESVDFLITRVIAFSLNFTEGLEFSPGLSTPDEPAIRVQDGGGQIPLWIDIGNPTARRLNKAAKTAKKVRVYTYKDPEVLKREVAGERIFGAKEIEIFSLGSRFLTPLGRTLARENAWTLLHTDGELVVTVGDETFMGTLEQHRLEG